MAIRTKEIEINGAIINKVNGITSSIQAQSDNFVHYSTDAANGFLFNSSITVNGDILPQVNGAKSLGNASLKWNTAYINTILATTINCGSITIANGNIYHNGSQAQYPMIRFRESDTNYGNGIAIGGGGSVIIGAGESSINYESNVSAGDETLSLMADAQIYFHSNCDTIENKKTMVFDVGGSLTVPLNVNASSFYASNWFRSTGSTGWHNETYGGGIYMEDSTWIRTYNNKKFFVNNKDIDAIYTLGGILADGASHIAKHAFYFGEIAFPSGHAAGWYNIGHFLDYGTYRYSSFSLMLDGSYSYAKPSVGQFQISVIHDVSYLIRQISGYCGNNVIQIRLDGSHSAGWDLDVYVAYDAAAKGGTIGTINYTVDGNVIYTPNNTLTLKSATTGTYQTVCDIANIPTGNADSVTYAKHLTGALSIASTVSNPAASTPTALSYGRLQSYGPLCINANTDNSAQDEPVIITSGKGLSSSASDGLAIGSGYLYWQGSPILHTGNYAGYLDSRYIQKTGDAMTGNLNVPSINNISFGNIFKYGYAYPFGKIDKTYFLVAQFTQSNAPQINTCINLLISEYFYAKSYGILTLRARAEAGSTTLEWFTADWSLCNNIDVNNFIVSYKIVNGQWTLNLYIKRSGWSSYSVRVLHEQQWGQLQNIWSLKESLYPTNAYASIPSDETQIVSTKLSIDNNISGSANKLNTNAGSSTRPVYFSGGVPVQGAYVWNWSGQSGQPTWIWGGSDGTNMYVYNPSNFNVLTSSYPEGFVSRTAAFTWGNTTGTAITAWNDSTGGSIGFRRDNPSSGKLSVFVDGRVYINEGNNVVMGMTYANGYWGLGTGDGDDTEHIRTTTAGLIPYKSGGGSSSLGTSDWPFNEVHASKFYGTFNGNATTASALLPGASNVVASTSNDTTVTWGAKNNTIHFYSVRGQLVGQPSQYGILCNFNNGGKEVAQLWFTQPHSTVYHRQGNSSGWSGSSNSTNGWTAFLDSSNYSSYALSLSGGTLTGSIHISHAANAIMDSTTTNPRITFSENGSQPVILAYTDYDDYRSPAGLKVLGGAYTSPAWFEVEGNIYSSSIYTSNWYRSTGKTGWYNETYSGGINMEDSTWIRVYNGKKFRVDNKSSDSLYTTGGIYADHNHNDYTLYSHIGKHRFYLTKLVGGTNFPKGWFTIARITGLTGYANFTLRTSGGWDAGSPTVATFEIQIQHVTASIRQISGVAGTVIANIRLDRSSNGWDLDVYQNYSYSSSTTMADQYFWIEGNVNATMYYPGASNVKSAATGEYQTVCNIRDMSGATNSDIASALSTNAGSATQPVYFSNGVPVACGSSLAVSVTGSAGSVAWGNVTDRIASGNEFNIIPDNYNSTFWFNYQSHSRNSSSTITHYAMGNGKGGYAPVQAADPTDATHLTTRSYADGRYVMQNGTTTMIGNLVLSAHGITTTIGNKDQATFRSVYQTTGQDHYFNKALYVNGGITAKSTLDVTGNATITGVLYVNNAWGDFYIRNAAGTTLAEMYISNSGQGGYGDFKLRVHSSASAKYDYNFSNTGAFTASTVSGAIWNDYAEYRRANTAIEPGRCVIETEDDAMILSYARLQPAGKIVSDTFGFSIGETEECKTPIAVSGRVLAYPFEPASEFKPGDSVCAGPNGTVSKMTREEIISYPDRIVGIVSCVPKYDTWGTGNVKVNGRIWIYVR